MNASRRIPPSQLSDDPERHVSDNRRVKLVHRLQTDRLGAAADTSDRFALLVAEVVADEVPRDEFD